MASQGTMSIPLYKYSSHYEEPGHIGEMAISDKVQECTKLFGA